MKQAIASRADTTATLIRVVVALEALIYLCGALLHLGAPLPVEFTEPAILDAAIVEGIITLAMVISAYGLFANAGWARMAAIVAHALAIAGVVLGMVALAFGKGPQTDANYIYHRAMIVVAAAMLVLLLTPVARAALRRAPQTP